MRTGDADADADAGENIDADACIHYWRTHPNWRTLIGGALIVGALTGNR